MKFARFLRVFILAWSASTIFSLGAAAQAVKLPENQGFVTIVAIMRENCARCHAWATSYSGIANPSRIVATLPEKSLLYRKIQDDTMPPSGKKLSAEEKELIRAWLAAGASSTDAPIVESSGIPQPCPCGLPQKPAPEAPR